MKKYLLSQNGNFYKANLHCHTTVSDGKKTPEEVKEIYQKLGYSVVAYTDHDILIPHNDLSDDNFLALNGFEIEINEKKEPSKPFRKCCHICFVALDKNNIIQPMWNEKYLFGNAPNYKHIVKYDETQTPYVREYNDEKITEMMQTGVKNGFFVTYNHPTWSRENYPEYIKYSGMNAFEMFNGGCIVEGYDDYNPRVYDDLLGAGKRIYCIGTDDNHNCNDSNSRYWDSGIAFTMINAQNLEYKSVTDALVSGNFYCSEGPEIYELWIEDGKIHIECSEADRIICTYPARKARVYYSENEKAITSATFKVNEQDGYFRVTVIDKQGRHACTNAYFTDEIL